METTAAAQRYNETYFDGYPSANLRIAFKLLSLLLSYRVEEYKYWRQDPEDSGSESSESTSPSLSLSDAVRSYPLRCLEALAFQLGLNFEKICAEMEKLQEFRKRGAEQSSKRRHVDVLCEASASASMPSGREEIGDSEEKVSETSLETRSRSGNMKKVRRSGA